MRKARPLPLSRGGSEIVRQGDHGLIDALRAAAGSANVLTDASQTAPYRTGMRYGEGPVAAVVTPRSLIAMWRVLAAIVDAGAIAILQAANTGLTGGSTPDGADYDRAIVMVSAMAIDTIHIIDEGRQAICLPGSTLFDLEEKLKPFDREPHSVIGSSCIGASVVGGICNNSGGALIRRGPAFTELALYATVGASGHLELVNHLGLALAGEPEEILDRVERGDFAEADLVPSPGHASDRGYDERVRAIDADSPARYNADPGRLFEASGCAGKLAIFAVRVDSFPAERETATFYIGTNDPDDLTALRRQLLSQPGDLPIAAEYMHRDCFDIAERYGKDSYLAIKWLGTPRLPMLFRVRRRLDAAGRRLGFREGAADRLLQHLMNRLPRHLPPRLYSYRDRYAHHLILKVGAREVEATRTVLDALLDGRDASYFHCSESEADAAFLHRFAAAGAAMRYRQFHADTIGDIVALDIALKRSDRQWAEVLPAPLKGKIAHALYYGHFFCHVFHQDYLVSREADGAEVERDLLALVDARGAKYPAEHGVGHHYHAEPGLLSFYRELDPGNMFNPGIGKSSKRAHWQ